MGQSRAWGNTHCIAGHLNSHLDNILDAHTHNNTVVVVVCKLVPDGAELLKADVEGSQTCPSTSQTSSTQWIIPVLFCAPKHSTTSSSNPSNWATISCCLSHSSSWWTCFMMRSCNSKGSSDRGKGISLWDLFLWLKWVVLLTTTVENFKKKITIINFVWICLRLYSRPYYLFTSNQPTYSQSKCCNEDWKCCSVSCKTHQEHCTQSRKNALRGSDQTDIGASLSGHKQSRACKQKDIQDLFDFLGQELHWCWQELSLRKAAWAAYWDRAMDQDQWRQNHRSRPMEMDVAWGGASRGVLQHKADVGG